MPPYVRRTSTKVVDGRVTRKSRSILSEDCGYHIRKEPAGRGFTHVVSPTQLRAFLKILPGWPDAAHRLGEIVLTGGSRESFGYHSSFRHSKLGLIALCAWPKDLWTPLDAGFYRDNRRVLDALGVDCQKGVGKVTARFTIAQARAFSLLDVFLHELGHHQDWLRRRGQKLPDKERVAEEYAADRFDQLLPVYCKNFGDPRRIANQNDFPETQPVFKRVI